MDEDATSALVRRAAGGDRAAADELVRLYQDHVRQVIHRRLGADVRAREDTDDIVQSTLVAALADLRGLEYRGEPAFRAWLATVAERRVKMAGRFHRQDKRDPGREVVGASGEEPALSATTPTAGAARSETRLLLGDAVAGLPEDERRIVELHSYRGLSFREAAEVAGLPDEDAARYLFRKALKRLGESLDDEA